MRKTQLAVCGIGAAVFVLALTACPNRIVTEIEITAETLIDRAEGILRIEDLSLLALSREPAVITLDNPNGYVFENIRWLFDGQDIGDGTETLVLGTHVNGQILRIGEHFLTIAVEIDGRVYSSRVAFWVTP